MEREGQLTHGQQAAGDGEVSPDRWKYEPMASHGRRGSVAVSLAATNTVATRNDDSGRRSPTHRDS